MSSDIPCSAGSLKARATAETGHVLLNLQTIRILFSGWS
ncbi:hypothetical protein SynBIOSE41_00113 [Synechococcus sp. BIOS-E4-1]|nr:hypothetical protein SynBIOSE41_00113 [Synechococcus sp. BIOS-E4-1]